MVGHWLWCTTLTTLSRVWAEVISITDGQIFLETELFYKAGADAYCKYVGRQAAALLSLQASSLVHHFASRGQGKI